MTKTRPAEFGKQRAAGLVKRLHEKSAGYHFEAEKGNGVLFSGSRPLSASASGKTP